MSGPTGSETNIKRFLCLLVYPGQACSGCKMKEFTYDETPVHNKALCMPAHTHKRTHSHPRTIEHSQSAYLHDSGQWNGRGKPRGSLCETYTEGNLSYELNPWPESCTTSSLSYRNTYILKHLTFFYVYIFALDKIYHLFAALLGKIYKCGLVPKEEFEEFRAVQQRKRVSPLKGRNTKAKMTVIKMFIECLFRSSFSIS